MLIGNAKGFALILFILTIDALATPDVGRDLAASCAACHSTVGPNDGGIPKLAGQSKDALVEKMRAFREGRQQSTLMHHLANGYTDEQIDAIATYMTTSHTGGNPSVKNEK